MRLSHFTQVVRTIKHSEEDVSSSFHTTVIPDARMVLATGCGAVVKIWDYRQRKCVREIETGGGALSHLSFSPDGAWVSSGTSAGELAVRCCAQAALSPEKGVERVAET